MNKLEANINIKDFEEFKVSHGILCEMLQDKNINVGIRLKYIHEFNNKIEMENNINVPYVKVNNLEEFKRVVAKMERETGLNVNACGHIFYPLIVGGDIYCGVKIFHDIDDVENYISADEYLTVVRESFTLDDLEDGMIIEVTENKNIKRYIVIKNSAIAINSYLTSNLNKDYNKDFSSSGIHDLHINKIYKFNDSYSFSDIFNKENLTLIFNAEAHRNKSKISQRKSEIENEIKKLQEELKLLEVK